MLHRGPPGRLLLNNVRKTCTYTHLTVEKLDWHTTKTGSAMIAMHHARCTALDRLPMPVEIDVGRCVMPFERLHTGTAGPQTFIAPSTLGPRAMARL